MNRSIARVAAVAGAVALVLAACSSGNEGDSTDTDGGGSGDGGGDALHIGTLLPVTGSLAQLGPPEIAGVDLAVAEINASPPGVLGGITSVVHRDFGDTSTDIATQPVTDLLSQNVSAIAGAASPGAPLTVTAQTTAAGGTPDDRRGGKEGRSRWAPAH